MLPVIKVMRTAGFLTWVYLDDFLLIDPPRRLILRGVHKLVTLLATRPDHQLRQALPCRDPPQTYARAWAEAHAHADTHTHAHAQT